MEKKDKRLEEEVQEYHIVVHNISCDEDNVRRIAKEKLGDVKIMGWDIEREINYRSPDINYPEIILPQRDIFVKLRYKEKNK